MLAIILVRTKSQVKMLENMIVICDFIIACGRCLSSDCAGRVVVAVFIAMCLFSIGKCLVLIVNRLEMNLPCICGFVQSSSGLTRALSHALLPHVLVIVGIVR